MANAIEKSETALPVQPERLPIAEVVGQVKAVQEVMKEIMHEGEHFGVIPGTQKPTLLQPGAQKLALTFRLRPEYELISTAERDDLIAYTVRCDLYHINSGAPWGSGLGSCNSREAKYRYRLVSTNKKPSKQEAEKLKAKGLGRWRRFGDKWVWQDRLENDNPWDQANTILKMAKKRAYVDAILATTAASDIFTQDLEDLGQAAPRPAPESAQNGNQGNESPPDDDQSSEAGIRQHAANRLALMFCDERKLEDGKGVDAAMAWLQKRMKSKKKLSNMTGEQLSQTVDAINELYEVWKSEGSKRGAYKNMEAPSDSHE